MQNTAANLHGKEDCWGLACSTWQCTELSSWEILQSCKAFDFGSILVWGAQHSGNICSPSMREAEARGHCKFQASQGSNIARLHPIKGKKEGRKGAGSGVESNKAEVRIPAE